jgi:hypothetical protein
MRPTPAQSASIEPSARHSRRPDAAADLCRCSPLGPLSVSARSPELPPEASSAHRSHVPVAVAQGVTSGSDEGADAERSEGTLHASHIPHTKVSDSRFVTPGTRFMGAPYRVVAPRSTGNRSCWALLDRAQLCPSGWSIRRCARRYRAGHQWHRSKRSSRCVD